MNARLKKIRQQQAKVEGKKKCRVRVALTALNAAVLDLHDIKRMNGEFACNSQMRAHMKKILRWTQECIAELGDVDSMSAGMERDFATHYAALADIRAETIGWGKRNVEKCASDIFSLAQLVTDIRAVEKYSSSCWRYLNMTLNTHTAVLVEFVPEMEETACNCGTKMFDYLYPEWCVQEWKEAA